MAAGPQNDPNVRLPAAVVAAAKRSDEIAAQIKQQQESPPAQTQSNGQNNGQNSGQNSFNTIVSDIKDGPPQHDSPPAEDENWEHQFKSIKGRYDAAEARNRNQSQQISELQRLLAMGTMNAPPAPAVPQGQPPLRPSPNGSAPASSGDVRFGGGQPFTPPKFVTEKETQEYGQELLDVMGRRTMEIVAPEFMKLGQVVNTLMAENQQLRQQVGGMRNVVTQDATGRFYDTLDRELPDWDNTNNDPEFLQWLDQVDPYSGRVRKELLTEAHTRKEATRVLNFIRGFRAERAAVNPVGDTQPRLGSNGGSHAPPPSPSIELRNLAAPGRAKSGQPPTPPDQTFITQAEITQFYADVTKGKYEGRDAEKTALEQQIFNAAKEGRVIQR